MIYTYLCPSAALIFLCGTHDILGFDDGGAMAIGLASNRMQLTGQV